MLRGSSFKTVGYCVAGTAIVAGGIGAYLYSDYDSRALFWYIFGFEKPLYNALINACEEDNLEKFKYLLEYVDDIDEERYPAQGGMHTLLGVVCKYDCFDMVKYLVEEKKVDINYAGSLFGREDKLSSLLVACSKKVREYLFMKGADLNIKEHSEKYLINFNDFKNPIRIAQEALKRGYDPNKRCWLNSVPLMWVKDNIEVAQCLINAGADINAQADSGENALSVANVGGHYNIVKLFIENGGSLAKKEIFALGCAIYHRNRELCDYFIRKENININSGFSIILGNSFFNQSFNTTILHGLVSGELDNHYNIIGVPQRKATKLSDKDFVVFLLAEGADPLIKDQAGHTVFECAKDEEIKSILKDKDSVRKAT